MKPTEPPSRTLRWGVALFVALQLADVPLTLLVLSRPGGRELNPLMAALLARTDGAVVAELLKLLIVGALAYTTATLWRVYPRLARVELAALCLLSFLLALNSVVNLLR